MSERNRTIVAGIWYVHCKNVGMNAAAAAAAAVHIKSSIITAVGCVFIVLILVRLDCCWHYVCHSSIVLCDAIKMYDDK